MQSLTKRSDLMPLLNKASFPGAQKPSCGESGHASYSNMFIPGEWYKACKAFP